MDTLRAFALVLALVSQQPPVPAAQPLLCPSCGSDLSDFFKELPPPQDLTLPEWIVVYDLPAANAAANATWTNLRVVVRAESEGAAIHKAAAYLEDFLDFTAYRRLKFIEAAPKLAPDEKK